MIKIAGISGSLRRASTNTALLRHAATVLPAGMELKIVDIAGVPLFNEDTEAADRQLPDVRRVLDALHGADAIVLAVNEYNYSYGPALKNVLDWASREPGNAALARKPVALMGSAGGMGSSRAQYQLRQVLVRLNLVPVNEEVFANAFAGAFDAEGRVVDPIVDEAIRQQMLALQDLARLLRRP